MFMEEQNTDISDLLSNFVKIQLEHGNDPILIF